jgi:hypothetical protein
MITEQIQLAQEPEITYNNGSEDWVNRIMGGLQKAYRKLVIESAAKNESLVVLIDGEVKHVPAKELMHTIAEPV